MTFPFRIVGFDLDGTLADTAADLAAAVNHALSLIDRAPLTEAEVRPMIGRGGKHMLERGLSATGGVPDSGVEPLFAELMGYYEAHIAVHTRLFPGVTAMLDRLDALGVRPAVVTNKAERPARGLLHELGIADRMATIIGGDTLPTRKPSPEPIHAMIAQSGGGRAAFVGDSIFDVMAAKGAAATSVIVRFGFLDRRAEDFGADHIIDHYDELLPLLETL
jgi:phosphoglycolate phosphatase